MQDGSLATQFSLIDKRIWVAGHRGMVGAALMRRLEHEYCDILTISHDELDLRDQVAVKCWVTDNKPDIIIISAAKVGGIMANFQNPAEFFYDNMMIATNIIHSAYEAEVEKLLFLGSSCIYPRECEQPIKESALLSGALEPTNEAYALAKIAGLKMAGYYRSQYGCDFISAMPCNLYGAGDSYDEVNSHIIPALIMKAHKAKISGANSISVWGSGKPLREFLYADDLVDGLVFLLKNYSGLSHVNIGSGREVRVGELVANIAEVVGYKGEITFDSSKPDGVYRKVMDSSFMNAAGWQPCISLDEGLGKSYVDYLNRFAGNSAYCN